MNIWIMIIFCLFSIPIFVFISILIMWALAKNDWLWTIVEEGQAKVVLTNGAFNRILMSYQNRIFARQDKITYHCDTHLEKEFHGSDKRKKSLILKKVNTDRISSGFKGVGNINHPWDIVQNKANIIVSKPLIPYIGLSSNIRWIGIPPFSQLYSYRFRWTSIEERADETKGQTKKVPYTTDKIINYIDLKPDVFLVTVTTAETSELVPLDIKLAITAQTINVYKTLFDAEKWLENVESQVGSKVRKFVGTKKYEELIRYTVSAKEKNKRNEKLLSNSNLEYILDFIKEEYGVYISRIQILDINPGSKKAEDFITASTQKYVKTEKAKGDIKEAEGFEKKYGSISKFPEGPEMYKMEQVKESNLRVYSSGNKQHDVIPTVTIDDVTNDVKNKKKKKGGENK